MLVLSRKIGESLVIQTATGEEIEVIVLEIKGNQARLGTEAEKSISVFREEVLERIYDGTSDM